MDYSLENKAKLLREVGYFPTNNFCNGRELKDLNSLKELGLNPVLKNGYIVQQRCPKEKLDFFMLGAYISKYTSLIYDIAMFYLALQKENKEDQIDYTFKEYIKKNLRDTTWDYQRLIKHKDVDVNLYHYKTVYTTVTEESFFTQYLNFDNINQYKLEVIEEKVQEEINKHYNFNISELFEQRSEYLDFLDYDYYFDFDNEDHRNVLRCDFIIENLKYKNGFYYDLEEEKFKEGKYYFCFSEYEEEVLIDIDIPLAQSLIDFGISEDKVKKFFKEERDSLNIIKEKINDIVKENNDLSPTYQFQEEEEVETPLYSQQEIVEYINNNEIWDKDFLSKFHSGLSNEEIVDFLDYYNHRIWNDYNKTGEEYYYYYFDKNLERKKY